MSELESLQREAWRTLDQVQFSVLADYLDEAGDECAADYRCLGRMAGWLSDRLGFVLRYGAWKQASIHSEDGVSTHLTFSRLPRLANYTFVIDGKFTHHDYRWGDLTLYCSRKVGRTPRRAALGGLKAYLKVRQRLRLFRLREKLFLSDLVNKRLSVGRGRVYQKLSLEDCLAGGRA